MDVLRFINSNAVREYLKEINYKFNTLEAAYLVYDCRFATLKEKHEAYREIIETMPDMSPKEEFERYNNDKAYESIHELLKQHLENEERWIKEFYGAEKAVYYYEFFWEDGKPYDRGYMTYRNISDSLEEITKTVEDYLVDDCGEVGRYEITCRPVGQERQYGIRFNRKGEMMEIAVSPHSNDTREDTEWELMDMWFGFPTPFKKGDIVYDPGRAESHGSWDGPFVLEETATEFYKKRGCKGCDSSDMTAYGYFIAEDGQVYDECMHNYMALEYYPKEKLTGLNRTLVAISSFMKDKIDIGLLMQAYRTVILEDEAKNSKPTWYTHEGMVLAGLEEE